MSKKVKPKAKKNKGGAPTKYSEDVVRKLERELRNNRKITVACRRAKISRETYYEWLKLYPDFSDRMTEAQESVIADLEDTAFRKARRDGHLSFRILQAIDPRYKAKVDIKDLTPPSAKRVIVGTPEADPMIRPDGEEKAKKG